MEHEDKFIPKSELIINDDNSIYHLQLKPGDLAKRIITVGDPSRIELIKPYFESIILEKANREFQTLTGIYKGELLSIISTGIGTDNIDIVINEVDALFNIDFESRKVKSEKTSVDFIRVGTSGSIQESIPCGQTIISEYAVGLEGLLYYYDSEGIRSIELEDFIHQSLPELVLPIYAVKSSERLSDQFSSLGQKGITLTATGFYAPQSRQLRARYKINSVNLFQSLNYKGLSVTNFEMETAGIFGLGKLLGHNAISISLILANRQTGEFSENPVKAVVKMIDDVMNLI